MRTGLGGFGLMHVDVVMPAYNAERWIAEAVSSVLQHQHVASLTIADDGSDVPITAESAGAFADSRCRVVRRENGGESKARNTAIRDLLEQTADQTEHDDSSWVMFFDADDLLLPTAFLAIKDADKAEGTVATVGARVAFYPDGRREAFDPPPDLRDRCFHTPDDAFRYIQVFASTGMTVRRSVLRAGELWDEKITPCSDIEFLHRLAKRGPVWVSTHPMLEYRMHTDGKNASGFKHLEPRVRGFVRTVELHHSEANDGLLRDQANWLLNQVSKHAPNGAAYDLMSELFKERRWPMAVKARVRRVLAGIR